MHVNVRGCDKNHFPKLIKAHTRILRIETFSPIISFSEIRNSLARWQIHDDEQSDSLFIVFGKLTHSEEIFYRKWLLIHYSLIWNSFLHWIFITVYFVTVLVFISSFQHVFFYNFREIFWLENHFWFWNFRIWVRINLFLIFEEI